MSDTASHFISIISFNPPNSPMCHYYPHLTDEEAKAEQSKGLTNLELHSKDSKPDLSDYQTHAYFTILSSLSLKDVVLIVGQDFIRPSCRAMCTSGSSCMPLSAS